MAASTSTGTRADGRRPGDARGGHPPAHGADVPAAEVHLRPHPQILPARPRPADRRAGSAGRPDAAGHRLRHRPQPCADRPALPGGSALRPGRGRADAGDRHARSCSASACARPWRTGSPKPWTRPPCSATGAASTTSRSPTACPWSTTPRRPLRGRGSSPCAGRHAARGRFRRHGGPARLVPARDGGLAGQVPCTTSAARWRPRCRKLAEERQGRFELAAIVGRYALLQRLYLPGA